MATNRIFYLDQLRALAIVAVVTIHVSAMYVVGLPPEDSGFAAAAVYNMLGHDQGITVFVMISGALLLGRDEAAGAFLKKRLSRILLPFLFWVLASVTFGVTVMGATLSWEYFTIILLGKPNYGAWIGIHFWYVWMLLGLYLVIPLLSPFLQKYGQRGAKYFLLLWLVTVALKLLGAYPFHSLELSTFAGYVGYAVLGYYLHRLRLPPRPGLLLAAALLLWAAAVALSCYWTVAQSLASGSYSSGSYAYIKIVASAGLFLAFRILNGAGDGGLSRLAQRLERGLPGRLTRFLSRCSYGIYLCHMLAFEVIRQSGLKLLALDPLLWIPLQVLVVTVAAWLVTAGLSKLPLLRKISGVC